VRASLYLLHRNQGVCAYVRAAKQEVGEMPAKANKVFLHHPKETSRVGLLLYTQPGYMAMIAYEQVKAGLASYRFDCPSNAPDK